MAVLQNNILAGAAGQGGAAEYVIRKSLRFNADNQAYLAKTVASKGDQRRMTFSFWIKRHSISSSSGFAIFAQDYATSPSNHVTDRSLSMLFESDRLELYDYGASSASGDNGNVEAWTAGVVREGGAGDILFRDPSAWYHIVFAIDTTQSTEANRCKVWINGVQRTMSGYPIQGSYLSWGQVRSHYIGIQKTNGSFTRAGDFSLADVQFIDGQQLSNNDFGEFNSSGVWVPKEFNGNYGTNGFKLDFSDSSTNEALGYDSAATVPDLDPKKGMDVITYTGNGGTQNIGGLNFEPGLIWLKSRSESSRSHSLYDNVRGASKVLKSDVTDGEVTMTGVTSFNPDGFALGSHVNSNNNNVTYVAWNWRAGGPAVSNTDGSITSQVSANTDYGFSVVKWTANNTYATIGHGLTNQTPKFILVKSTASGTSWVVYHHSLGNTRGLNLNLSGAGGTDQDYWNNTSPTTSVFSVGNFANYQTAEHVAYVWSEVPGYSKFGSYTGNGSSTGPVVTTGFKPKWVLIKRTDSGPANWYVLDTERDPTNPVNALLRPNQDSAEISAVPIDILSTGFQPKDTDAGSNASGGTYIYAAFADRPGNDWNVNNIVTNEGLSTNKKNFDVVTYTGNGGMQKIGGGADFSGTATITYDGTPDTSYTTGLTSAMFDGSTSTAFGVNNGSSNKFVNIAFATGITVSSSLKVHAAFRTGMVWQVNGNTVTSSGVSHPNTGLQTLNFTGTMNSLRCEVANGNALEIHLIEVDGLPLLDGNGLGLSFQPDFVWVKTRSHSQNHGLFDSVRGAGRSLRSSTTGTEQGPHTGSNGDLTSFNSDGFTVGSCAASGAAAINLSGQTQVAWCWKAGGTAVSNTDGSITSSVSANVNYGFSIASFTGSGSTGTVGTGLSGTKLVILKNKDSASNWVVYHTALDGSYDYMYLNSTNSNASSSLAPFSMGNTFKVASNTDTNASGDDYVAYCFADVPGYQRIGSYTGNGSSTGPVVVTGFKPRWVMIKRTDSAEQWYINDSERDPSNPTGSSLRAQSSGAEATSGGSNSSTWDMLPNGFQLKDGGVGTNASGGTYIYLAIGDDEIGSDEDCLVDVPNAVTADEDATDTTGGYQRGNYATLNPLQSALTLTNGNLGFNIGTRVDWKVATATIHISSGKWFWEATNGTINTTSGANTAYGIRPSSVNSTTQELGYNDGGGKAYFSNGGTRNGDTSGTASYGASFGTGDVIGVAFDADNGTLEFYKNGVSQGTAFTGLTGTWAPAVGLYTGGTQVGTDDFNINFGQQRFKYPIPSGYAALNTTALPSATIGDGSDYFDAKPYSGIGTSQTITGLSFSPDMLWLKSRSSGSNHAIWDTIRGVSTNLTPNTDDAEGSVAITSFDSNGFTLGDSFNGNGLSMIAWAWDAGSSTVSNTDGSITSSVRANQTAGFSVVTYTGAGSTSSTVGHGLNAAPEFIITKARETASQVNGWRCYHSALGNTKYIELNTTAAAYTFTDWANTTPTNSVFSVGGSGTTFPANENNIDYVAYCFAPVAGYSAFGTFEGNGSGTDGPFIYTGFKPALVVIKRTDAANDWNVQDYQRKAYNGQLTTSLQWNTNSSESSIGSGYERDILSNGFKLRTTGTETNASGGQYLYIAFAQNPFQANGGLAR